MQKKPSNKVSHFPKRKTPGWNKKKLFFSAGAMLAVFLLLLFGFYSYRLYLLNQELEKVEEELSDYTQKEKELLEEIERWDNEEYLEKKAREELGLTRPGERIIIIED